MQITPVQALIIGIWVAIVMSRGIGYATLTLRFSPLMTGLVCGIVMGNVHDAMVITAAIQLIYMGVFAPGGAMPSEPAVATAISVPTALMAGNMAPEAAVAVAVPVGLLGSYLYQLRFFFNTFIGKLTDRYIEEVNESGMALSIMALPILISFLIYVPIIYLALMYGSEWIIKLTNSAQGTAFFNALKTIGGGLSAIGIALTMHVIGKRRYLIFFFLAYFMAKMFSTLKIGTVTYAIIGACIAFIYIFASTEGRTEDEDY